MAYDEDVAQRFRDCLIGLPDVSEMKMMGGVCFLLNGNMIGGTHIEKSGAPVFMFRVGKNNMAEALARPGARIMINGGRPVSGFIRVEVEGCSEGALSAWISLCVSSVGKLPAKRKG